MTIEHRLPSIPLVYLAGGMRSNWQQRVRQALPHLMYMDPRDHGFTVPRDAPADVVAAIERG